MSLILVTGTSTSGKSTIAKELSVRGYEAYDTEHNGISAWYDKDTGERAAEFGNVPERTAAWARQHEWLMSINWVKEVAQKAGDKPVFLCGGASNETEVCGLCSQVCWLATDEQTIRSRVRKPREHTYGTKSHELATILEENERKETSYREYGAAMIDATRPVKQVVDDILAHSRLD